MDTYLESLKLIMKKDLGRVPDPGITVVWCQDCEEATRDNVMILPWCRLLVSGTFLPRSAGPCWPAAGGPGQEEQTRVSGVR